MEKSIAASQASADAATISAKAAMIDATEMQRQSTAAERSSTAGRAYLFASYDVPQAAPFETPLIAPEPSRKERFVVTVKFSIKNFGPTPAIITKFQTHLLIGADGRPINNEIDPRSAVTAEMKEQERSAAVLDISSARLGNAGIAHIDDDPTLRLPLRIIFPANAESGVFAQRFIFRNRIQPIGPSVDGAWFYCFVTYKDIFSIERHTSLYVILFAAGMTYGTNPAYNYWD